ncbi:T9SS C-terminal target domain-containing protein [Maribellus luteus]|uniref:T9SS C-terminal target domain-containing protein n=1 Tax=Maribellus luteus TaxID=2305463 RepID=A0A399ST32_9BACT|nr:T9SS type A sorting domain-containing protein [Maribellus luteus]RIJ47206.1 T9SS C-terminal target domain-containing protein [Maribellus luteus]
MKKIYLIFSSSRAAIIVLITGLFMAASMTTYAQTTPADCVSGCTSNDIQIENAYLSDEFGNPLDSNFVCENGQDAIVYLTLELSTNTPRVGVSIYTKIKELDLGVPRGTLDSMSQCFGDTLNQPLNRVTFNQTLSWPCGTAIALTDVYIAWGTGNKNFCEGEAFQCPKTPSKCFSLPGGDYIAVEIPTAKNFSYESCPDVPGGTTATFNLRSLDTLVTKSTDVNIEWYKDFATDSLISIPESYTTKSAEEDVYAKVTSTIPPYPSSVATVALIVYPSPTVTLTDPSDVCFDGSAMSFEGSPKPNQGISGVFSTNAPAESFTDKGDGTASLDPSVAGVGTFEVIYTFTDTNGCLEDDTVSVEVFDNPVAPTDAVPVTVCENGEEQTLTATATVPDGDTIIWYSAPTGGDEVYPPALVSTVADTLILYGETVNKLTLCTSLDRTPDTLIINPAPVAPINPIHVTECETGEEQTLTATATVPDGVSIVWYDAGTNGNIADPASLVSTVADTLILYGEAVDDLTACKSLSRTADTLIINPAPSAPINPVNVTECETGEEQTLTATATVPDGVSIVWYDAETNGNVADPASLVSTVADTLILYGEAVDDLTACKSLSRTADTLIINPAPAAPTNPVNVTECETGEEQTLTATATVPDGVSIVWYDAETNGNVADPASLVSTIADTLILYGEAVDDLTACKSLSRTADTLIINPAPAAPINPVNVTECETGEEQTLTATATVPDGVSIVWYDAETNGNIADPASLVSTVADTLILYGEAVDDLTGCKSLSRTADTLIINPAPAAPKVVYNPPACDDSTFSVTITNVVKDATYTIKDKNGDDIPGVFPGNSIVAVNKSDTSFSNIPAGSGYKVTVQIGDCISLNSESCGLPTKSATIAQVVKSTPITQTVKSAAIGENLNSEFSVKAYPNPFSDQVKFEVNLPEESNGSLELFNMLGQKVKIIHQGHMNAGINTFEVSLSGQQSTTLIYRLKAGDKQLTGKLLQVKQ